MGKRSDLSPAERREIVLEVLRKERPLSAVARERGIADGTVNRWCEQFLEGGLEGLKSKGAKTGHRQHGEVERLQAENDELKRTIGEFTIANNILKKRVGHLL